MKTTILFLLLLAWPLAGCRHLQTSQMSGTELGSDASGRSTAVTYVTPEEYARMTPAERQRLHAQVGVQVSMPLFGNQPVKGRDLTEDEVKQALGK
jgi:hypothetical protein